MNGTWAANFRVSAEGNGSAGGRSRWAGVVFGLGVALSACTTPYEGKFDFYQGWRKATVVQPVAVGEVTKYDYADCRKAASAEQLSTGRFAAVSYRGNRHQRTRIVAFPVGTPLRKGDLVYVNAAQCFAEVATTRVGAP